MRALLDHITWHSPELATFAFKPAGYFRFIAGEFTELHVRHQNPDNRGISRQFTIASTPNDPLVNIITTFAAAGQRSSTFKQALRALRPGDEVILDEAMGDFVVPKHAATPLIFVAGGIGITPVLSIVRALQQQNDIRNVTVAHLSSRLLDFELDTSHAFKTHAVYTPILRQPTASWTGETGELTVTRLQSLCAISSGAQVYLSGPETMVADMRKQLIDAGVDELHIIVDEFTHYRNL